jgi:transglutaminase-like putative cysteine protease
MRHYSRVALLLAASCGVAFVGQAGEVAKVKLDPNLPYQAAKRNPVTYQVDFSAVVTAPYHTKVLKVWLPLPPTDAAQAVSGRDLSTFPMKVEAKLGKEPLFGNEFAYFEFHEPQGGQIIRHKFSIKVWELNWNLDPKKVVAVEKWPDSFKPFLRSDRSVVVDERFQKLVGEILPFRQGPVQDLATMMTWVNEHLKYDHAHASLKASSEHALTFREGHCSDYHGFCAALGRALNFPTRVTYGINPFPKNSPSHCKLEVYLPPYGWVSFDVSETQQLIKRIQNAPKLDKEHKEKLARAARERLQRGFRDNTWFLQTRGTDYDLAPPAAKRVNVVRTIYAEADGTPLPEPDPANPNQRQFGWMTAHRYVADRTVTYPFQDWHSLEENH